MTEEWAYQVRLYLSDAVADLARRDPGDASLATLADILKRHDATLMCQFDAFAAYVAEAEKAGVDRFPLYKWTKATIEDPARREKHLKAFAVRVGGEEVYPKAIADALESDLQPMVDGKAITRISKHDTNPAHNIPVPADLR